MRELILSNSRAEQQIVVTESIEKSPSWETDRYSASQEIPRIHESPPTAPIRRISSISMVLWMVHRARRFILSLSSNKMHVNIKYIVTALVPQYISVPFTTSSGGRSLFHLKNSNDTQNNNFMYHVAFEFSP